MRQIAKLLACGAILAAAAPVIAQAHDGSHGYSQDGDRADGSWNNGGETYDKFIQEYDHTAEMIRHSVSDGTLNQRQVAGSLNELRYIRRLAYTQQQRGNYNPRIIQARLGRLHEGLHLRHVAGHQAQERADRNRSAQYGSEQDRYGRRDSPAHDDHDHRDSNSPR